MTTTGLIERIGACYVGTCEHRTRAECKADADKAAREYVATAPQEEAAS